MVGVCNAELWKQLPFLITYCVREHPELCINLLWKEAQLCFINSLKELLFLFLKLQLSNTLNTVFSSFLGVGCTTTTAQMFGKATPNLARRVTCKYWIWLASQKNEALFWKQASEYFPDKCDKTEELSAFLGTVSLSLYSFAFSLCKQWTFISWAVWFSICMGG